MSLPDGFLSIAPLDWHGLFSALPCGGIVDPERQVCGQPGGIRTSALICAVAAEPVAEQQGNGQEQTS